MPVQVLRPNFAQDVADAGLTPDGIFAGFDSATSSPSFVGSQGTLWRDDDTGTYADLTTVFTNSGGSRTNARVDLAVAPLDQLSVDSTRATLNSVRVEWTAVDLTTNHPTADPYASLDLLDSTTFDLFYGYMAHWQAAGLINTANPSPQDFLYPADEAFWDLEHPDTSVAYTPAEVLDFLASGNVMAVAFVNLPTLTSGTWTSTGRVQDIKVTVDYTLTRRPINRIHPRGDGARIFPAQATNRIAGGYY